VTQHQFIAAVLALPFTMAAGLWIYAFSLCERTGRIWLTAGLYLVFEPRVGRHEAPIYEDEPVHIRERRTEDQRIADYAAMRAETQQIPVTVSAAPYASWAAELYPDEAERLRDALEDIERRAVAAFQVAVDRAVEEFLREVTTEQQLVPA